MGQIQKTVTVLPQGDNYQWEDVNGAVGNWLSLTQNGSTDTWTFATTGVNNTGSDRTATFRLLHSTFTEFPGDPGLKDEFTITQLSSQQSLPAFTYADWTGSLTGVDAAGNVNIVNGNSSTVTSNPASFAANTTMGTNQVSLVLTVTVPAGYSNTGGTVDSGTLTVTQPTSYVAPQTITGSMNINYGASGGDVCTGAGTSVTGVAINITGIPNPTNAQWQTQARAQAADHLNTLNVPAGQFYKVTAISDHNNGTIPTLNEFVEYDGGGIIGDVDPCPNPQYTVNITANSAIANASIYNVASGGVPNNVITQVGEAGTSISDAFYVEANSGYNISPSQVSISSWGGGGSNTYVNPNVNAAGRVVVGWNDTLDPNNLNFAIGIAGSVSQLTYTVNVVETNSSSTICSETVSNNTFTYPQGEGGVNFQNYFLNNYSVTGTDGSIKIISSNEPNFSWAGWAITMNSENEPMNGGWFNCNAGPGGQPSVSISGEEWIYTMGSPEDYTGTPSNIFGSGGNGNPDFQWALSGINANKFQLTNDTAAVCTVEYIGTGVCGGGGHSATLTCTATGFDSNGQSIPSVSDTKTINGCDDSGEGGSGS
tara:strand:- start:3336 stop:5123 length:1788 start_codon:yes stop_codon:yes gene_type:complete